jgi:hypothetical protein
MRQHQRVKIWSGCLAHARSFYPETPRAQLCTSPVRRVPVCAGPLDENHSLRVSYEDLYFHSKTNLILGGFIQSTYI